jgi:hypothetical protein
MFPILVTCAGPADAGGILVLLRHGSPVLLVTLMGRVLVGISLPILLLEIVRAGIPGPGVLGHFR